MATKYDTTEFVDTDFQAHKSPFSATTASSDLLRAPTREEIESRVTETQQKLAELKRAQDELERERATLEETRRRQSEFHMGRQEMVQNLTRGIGLLEKSEFTARREAEQMAKSLNEFRDALAKVQGVNEETWTKDNLNVELTRALTTVDNARMEWNSARMKFDVLNDANTEAVINAEPGAAQRHLPLGARSLGELWKFGLALTWPLVLVALLTLGALVTFMILRR